MPKEKIDMHGCDSMVECEKCGKRSFLNFANGLRNGWGICCGYTMTLKIHPNGKVIEKAVTEAIDFQTGGKTVKIKCHTEINEPKDLIQ